MMFGLKQTDAVVTAKPEPAHDFSTPGCRWKILISLFWLMPMATSLHDIRRTLRVSRG
jgi:hypothetical protein